MRLLRPAMVFAALSLLGTATIAATPEEEAMGVRFAQCAAQLDAMATIIGGTNITGDAEPAKRAEAMRKVQSAAAMTMEVAKNKASPKTAQATYDQTKARYDALMKTDPNYLTTLRAEMKSCGALKK